jgi:hypothetical protein
VVEKADQGQLSRLQPQDSPFLQEFAEVVKKLVAATPKSAGATAA